MTLIVKPNLIYDIYQEEFPVHIDEMTNPVPLAVIIRASWQALGARNRGTDIHALEYVTQCKALGMRYGLYHFLTPNGIAEQAALFLKVWEAAKGADIVPIVDVEVDLPLYYNNPGAVIGQAVWQGHIKTFLDAIAAGTGRTPMIYTSQKYWAFTYTRQPVLLSPPTWTASYPLWVAQYPTDPNNASAPLKLPGGWTQWAIWQYFDKGRSNGYPASDMNTVADWYLPELDDDDEPTPDPDPIPEPIPEGKIVTLTTTYDDPAHTVTEWTPK